MNTLNLFQKEKLIQVIPIINNNVRNLCVTPYEGHPKGCPNFNNPSHSHRCPPKVPKFYDYFDIAFPIYVVVNEFDLADHVRKMLFAHPNWSDKQLRCVLYWQNTARKQLSEKINKALKSCINGYEATWCPEGMGVDVTTTLKEIGITLEWPVVNIARQVAFLGKRRV